MICVQSAYRNARIGGSAALTVIVAAGLVIVPGERRDVPVETHQVQLAAAIVGALANSSTVELPQSVDAESAWVGTRNMPVAQAVPMAADTAEDDFWSSPIGMGLTLLNLLALPLWFFAMPVTLPLSMIGAAMAVPKGVPDALGGFMFLIATAVGFLTGPMGFIHNISLRGTSTDSYPAASHPAAGRPGPAQAIPASTVGAIESAVPAQSEAPADRTVSTGSRDRGRLVSRQVGRTARVAAASAAEGPMSGDAQQAVPDPDRSTAVRTPNLKANAQRNSRR